MDARQTHAADKERRGFSALAASRSRNLLPHIERDMPMQAIVLIGAACLPPLAALLAFFLKGNVPAFFILPLVFGTLLYILVMGFLVAATCEYMAGLFGSSNSPVSGLAILTVIGVALPLAALGKSAPAMQPVLVAYALFVCSIVLCIATIANDNLQDLKTGLLVGATPWKQQAALIVGVAAGAAAIPPVLQLLNRAYGFIDGVHSAHALPAPQATLISTLAVGVMNGKLAWGLLGAGAAVGMIAAIALDEILGATHRLRLPPLAIGFGHLSARIHNAADPLLGRSYGWYYKRFMSAGENAERAARFGILAASGLIVGESLFGVALAALSS